MYINVEDYLMNDINNFMVYFNLLIGAYVTYAAIAGKGKAFENDYPKEIKEEVFKFNRIMYFVVGPVLLVSSILELMKITFFSWFSIGFILAAIVVYMVIFFKKFGKALKESRKKKF